MGGVYPGFLEKGDKVCIISPSGKVSSDFLSGMEKRLRTWELEVSLGTYADAAYRRFAGTDKQRLADLQQALDNPDIKAIFCSRGGYGCIHLLDKINWSAFSCQPKWLIGYSDITVFHSAITNQGIVSVHAPMARHFTETGEDDSSLLFLKNLLFGKQVSYTLPAHPLNRTGKTKGRMTGGNLSVLSGLRGTETDIIPQGAILFIEDIGEQPYHIERMLYNFKLGGILQHLSGLIIGQFSGCKEDPQMPKPLYETISALISAYTYPVCFNFPVGHVTENYPLLCGAACCLEITSHGTSLSFPVNLATVG
ncbi:MAG: LD-carboxypeptidase [Candidatus Azobacteroides sp.]|nr:LD-carboxypeptidase [Candidatus Azobacteroides sp.]